MKFVLCSSWSLPGAAQGGSATPVLSPVGCTGSPSPGHDHFCQHCPAGVLLQHAGHKRGEAALPFLSAPLAMSSQVGNDREISLDVTFGNVGALERALPAGLKLGRWGMTGPSVFTGTISETHQGQALKSRGSIENVSGVLEVGDRHLPLVLLQLSLY